LFLFFVCYFSLRTRPRGSSRKEGKTDKETITEENDTGKKMKHKKRRGLMSALY